MIPPRSCLHPAWAPGDRGFAAGSGRERRHEPAFNATGKTIKNDGFIE
jgi:hypothetical protein